MSQIFKASAAYVREAVSNRRVRLIESQNPEIIIAEMLREYFVDVGFNEMYPNFGNINIGTIHPFALFLFAETKGESQNFNLLPSITVANGSTEEASVTLNQERVEVTYSAAEVAIIEMQKANKVWFISDTGLASLKTATANGSKAVGIKTSITSEETFTLEIWADNKDITSLIYDMVHAFIYGNTLRLNEAGLQYQNLRGQRTGDINMDFGKILYGANITYVAHVPNTTVEFDVVTEIIGSIKTTPTGEPLTTERR
jgi:hypothetical protein